jgi:malonyl-CoA O-methyltransferase
MIAPAGNFNKPNSRIGISKGLDKRVIKRNFSRCALYYDRYCSIQNLCASELIAKFKAANFRRILDIGCGTGNYTKLLRKKFPYARIKAVDISPEMIKVGKNKLPDEEIEFVVADGERLDFQERFDLISSNASFQWFENLGAALWRYENLLNKGGSISFSAFGPLTYFELERSLKELFGTDIGISAGIFFEGKKLLKVLNAHFRKIAVEQKIYKERYNSLSELLKKIKYTGIRGNGANKDIFWTPKAMSELEGIYKSKFKKIIASYPVFFCKGAK